MITPQFTVIPIQKDDVASELVVCDLAQFLTMKFPPREMFLAPWLESQSLSMLYSWRGVGKTHVALGIAYALASAGSFLGWTAANPVPVLYVDGEMPAISLQERLAAIVASSDKEATPGMFKFVTPDLQPNGVMPNLALASGQSAIERAAGNARVIVLDNLSCLVRGVNENEAEAWSPIATWALRQRAHGRSLVFVHHAGKGGAQRGTSHREDPLDTVINLKRPAGYNPADGAQFEIHFQKARALLGQSVSPFEAKLETMPDGRETWTMNRVEHVKDARMKEMAELGMSHADIAKELGCDRTTVYRALKKAKNQDEHNSNTSAKRGKK